VLPKDQVLSLTPRFSEVETGQRRVFNRFNGLAAGKTVETVSSLLQRPLTALKRGVNETEIVFGQHAREEALNCARKAPGVGCYKKRDFPNTF
jgi:hypothetical protein